MCMVHALERETFQLQGISCSLWIARAGLAPAQVTACARGPEGVCILDLGLWVYAAEEAGGPAGRSQGPRREGVLLTNVTDRSWVMALVLIRPSKGPPVNPGVRAAVSQRCTRTRSCCRFVLLKAEAASPGRTGALPTGLLLCEAHAEPSVSPAGSTGAAVELRA